MGPSLERVKEKKITTMSVSWRYVSEALAQNQKKPWSMFNVKQGKLHGDNEMALMGLTPSRKVLAVFTWRKKAQHSNTIIAGPMCFKILWLQASVCVYFLHCTSALVSIRSLFKGCVCVCECTESARKGTLELLYMHRHKERASTLTKCVMKRKVPPMLYLCPIEREHAQQDTITVKEETGLNKSQQPAIRNVNTLLLCLLWGCLLK